MRKCKTIILHKKKLMVSPRCEIPRISQSFHIKGTPRNVELPRKYVGNLGISDIVYPGDTKYFFLCS